MWLMCLSPRQVTSLYVPDFSSLDRLKAFVAGVGTWILLLECFILRFGISKWCFGHIPSDTCAIWLVSGSLLFLRKYLIIPGATAIGVLDAPFWGRLRKGVPTGASPSAASISWSRIKHASVGGPTSYIGLFGVFGSDSSPQTSIITRTIKHFLDFGTRPKFAPGPPTPTTSPIVYSDTDLLDPQYLDRPVRYASHFFSSGWGERALATSELGAAYGFPTLVRALALPLHVFQHVPADLLLSVLDPIIRHNINGSEPVRPSLARPLPVIRDEDPRGSWIPNLGQFLSHSTWVDDTLITTKAAKRDDAAAPCPIWDSRLELLFPGCSAFLPRLRLCLLSRQRRRILKEGYAYLRRTFGQVWWALGATGGRKGSNDQLVPKYYSTTARACHDIALVRNVIRSWSNGSWWEWDVGSSLIFWRWDAYMHIAREGMTPHINGTLPLCKIPSPNPKSSTFQLIAPKLKTIVERGYVSRGNVLSLTQFFAVPKADDVRIVYNGSSCGLNDSIWAPNFWLPYPRSAVQLLTYNFYSADMDLGEIFLNFPLHKSIQLYSEIDLTPYAAELLLEGDAPHRYKWERNWMGSKSSPYSSVRFYYLAEDFFRGDRLHASNPLRWDSVRLNLPGSPTYDPAMPRVMKWNNLTNSIAGDVIAFVDDLRATSPTLEQAWDISRLVSSRLQLGVQDVTRKRRPPTRTLGAWTGAIFATDKESITKTISQDKWDKAKSLVHELWLKVSKVSLLDLELSYKHLEVVRGFLGHIAMTFEWLVSHLKGFHLILAGHNKYRDIEGWKISKKEWKRRLQVLERSTPIGADQSVFVAPKMVKVIPQFRDDLYALNQFFENECPPVVQDRCIKIREVIFGFGDASGTGCGSTITSPEGVAYRIGLWGRDQRGRSN